MLFVELLQSGDFWHHRSRHGPALGGFFCTGLLHLAKLFGGFAIRLTLSKHTQIVYMKALLNSTYTEECSGAP